jgi:hypothetical protein
MDRVSSMNGGEEDEDIGGKVRSKGITRKTKD